MDIRESIREALKDPDVENAIRQRINSVAESKAEQLTQELLDKKTAELNEDCEKFKKYLEDRSNKLTEKYKSELNEEYNKKSRRFEERYVEQMTEQLSKYTNEVVNSFLEKYKDTFKVNQTQMRASAVLEALSAVCAVAGVRAEQITEGVKYFNDKQTVITDERVKNLKNQLRLSEEANGDLERQIQDLKDDLDEAERNHSDALSEADSKLDSERQKAQELKEALKESAKEAKDTRLDVSDALGEIKRLEGEKRELLESLKQAKKKNKTLEKENTEILKIGAITEMKQGMSLTAARRFEQIASEIPFEKSRQYFDKLEILKNELMNNPKYKKLNEITGEEMGGEPIDQDELESSESSESPEDFSGFGLDGIGFDKPNTGNTEVSRWDRLI